MLLNTATRSSLSACTSNSDSEPSSPDLPSTLPSTLSTGNLSSVRDRRRFMISSVSPYQYPLKKRQLLPDSLMDRMVPATAALSVCLFLAFHFVVGFGATSSVKLDIAPLRSADVSTPLRMKNSDVVSELERWRDPDYARRHLKVYYYDLPSRYNRRLVEQSHRNPPKIRDPYCDENFYSAENTIARFFETSPVRTLNASEADYFYVPIFTTCYLFTHLPNDLNKTGNFFENAMSHVINDYPYWNRSDGRDHVFMFAQGFGARLSGDWQRYRQATFLVHNGDYEEPHYNAHKDIVVPPDLSHYLRPVGLTSPGRLYTKSNFVLFGGQVISSSVSDHRGSNYSGGVRQYIQRHLSHAEGYKVTGVRSTTYVKDMMESVFCLAPHGWHKWSPRPAYAILLGCIPVVISEQQELFLEDILDYSEISMWVRPGHVRQLDRKLRAIDSTELRAKEMAMRDIWRLFWYGSDGLAEEAIMFSLYRKLTSSRMERAYL